ncbi:hypothetical protein FRC00_002610 [Tulasnella sp. 408]|nr:hypothetical protein FRC00_002610 [Tulasnella sp. 408]
MAGATLADCDPEGIKFLFDVLQDVTDVLEDGSFPSAKMTAMNGIKSILSEALEGYRWSGDDAEAAESQNLSERECGTGDSEHVNDNFRGEGWKFQSLCKWILEEIRAQGLEDNGRCKQITLKVEEKWVQTAENQRALV